MRTTTTIYEEVSIKATKKWKNKDGKWRTKTRKFYQTLNPFNTKDGRLKTYSEIMKEIMNERDEWLSEPEQ